MSGDVGTFCLVLHSHLPWVARHGRWPVGEEWLYQAWMQCYLPLVRVLRSLADEGRGDLLTLGITPVLAAQLDDPGCLDGARSWAADWWLRAQGMAGRDEPALRALATGEFRAASAALADLEGPWSGGGSPVLRGLADDGVVELLGGPATHPFLPLLEPALVDLALAAGLDDARWRLGSAPAGLWSPECGHSPGLERHYAAAGVHHLVLDEATMAAAGRDVHAAWRMAGTEVVAVARDLSVTDRIWSSRTGYPAGPHYRDFHAYDRASGTRPYAVTGPGAAKRWYDPGAAAGALERDAADFVTAVRTRLAEVAQRDGRPGLLVVAYDTELFGHWWHEGPQFLATVLRRLPEAGVRVTTLEKALRDAALVAGDVELGPGSWGAGKDFRVWAGDAVRPLLDEAFAVQRRLLDVLARERDAGRLGERRRDLDQLVRQALLVLSSDWAFMVTRDSAAPYALDRADGHRRRFSALAELVDAGPDRRPDALAEAARQRRDDGPFGWLDARAYLP
jgi:1,4-alpha-glucan branching enzyme